MSNAVINPDAKATKMKIVPLKMLGHIQQSRNLRQKKLKKQKGHQTQQTIKTPMRIKLLDKYLQLKKW